MSALAGHTPQRDPANDLTPTELRNLRRLTGFMIPAAADYGVPGADDEAIFADIVRSLGRDRSDVRKALAMLRELAGGDFAALVDAAGGGDGNGAPSARVTRDHGTRAGRSAMLLPRRTRGQVSGPRATPAFPKGHMLEQGDWSLLDAVRGRPRMWRDVDGRGAEHGGRRRSRRGRAQRTRSSMS